MPGRGVHRREDTMQGTEHHPSEVEQEVRRIVEKSHERMSWAHLEHFYGMSEKTLQNVAYNRAFSIETAVRILRKHGLKLVIEEDKV